MVLLGMVGFAEGIIAVILAQLGIGVFLVTVCAALGLLRRSRVAAVAGLLLVALTAFLFQPWVAFTVEPSDDWDAQELEETYLFLARWWVLASVAAAGGTVRAFWRRRVDALSLRDLTVQDLARCPIWRYEGLSDESATVSPAPAFEQPEREVYIARTRFVLADGSEWWGYCSPTDDSGLDYTQPVLLAPGGPVRFWYAQEPADPEPARACRLLGKRPEQVFPARFECVVPFEGRFARGELIEIDFGAEPAASPHPGGIPAL
ncbi:MAG TPA: hypothetical protein VKD72_27315 [Gemmataceae bacterium]|nr:hypothetical protein [Gemmataceae bacterium]